MECWRGQETGQSRGFAFVDFGSVDQATAVLNAFGELLP